MPSRTLEQVREDYNRYLNSTAWATRRNAAIERAGGRCQLCNRRPNLHVHHRTYERIGNEDPGDLTVLCQGCHEHFHGVNGPSPRTVKRPATAKQRRKRRHKAIKKKVKKSKWALSPGTHAQEMAAMKARNKKKRSVGPEVRMVGEIKPWDTAQVRLARPPHKTP